MFNQNGLAVFDFMVYNILIFYFNEIKSLKREHFMPGMTKSIYKIKNVGNSYQ